MSHHDFKLNLQDGFQDIFTFTSHRLQVRGYNMVEIAEDPKFQSEFGAVEQFLSWDSKQLILWESNLTFNKPTVLHTLKLAQANYICSVVFIPKLKIFLAAALDMSFKLYSRQLQLLESIHHEERAILHLEYDLAKDIIIASGASGV